MTAKSTPWSVIPPLQFSDLKDHIYGEETNEFKNELGKTFHGLSVLQP